MESVEFKVGDKVLCVEEDPLHTLQIGRTYTVSSSFKTLDKHVLHVEGVLGTFNSSRFQLSEGAEPTDNQVGGNHYSSKAIQPIIYIQGNNLNFCEGSIVKYITRWREKGGIEDLEKIKHYCDFLIEEERKSEGSQ